MGVPVQESLLDMCDDGPALGALGGLVRRTPLAHGAWVDLRRGWLAGSGAVFARLAENPGIVPWRAEKRQMYDKMATMVSSVRPRPVVSPCQATLSRPSRYRHRPAVRKGSPSSGP